MTRVQLFMMAALAAMTSAGCQSQMAGGGPAGQTPAAGTVGLAQFTPVGAPIGAADSSYRIGVSDVLSVSVFQVPDLSTANTQVGGDGTIALPLAGSIRAAGLTPGGLENQIKARLTKFVQNPQVTVSITQFNSRRYTVDGAINRPGVFPIMGSRSSLLTAVASAGGFSTVADPSSVVVYRNVAGTKQAARFDAKAIQAGATEDPEILSGDVIVVDASGVRSALQEILPAVPAAGMGENIGERIVN